MKKAIKWYFDQWRKPEEEWTYGDALDMIWASVAIVCCLGGLVILFFAIYNDFFR